MTDTGSLLMTDGTLANLDLNHKTRTNNIFHSDACPMKVTVIGCLVHCMIDNANLLDFCRQEQFVSHLSCVQTMSAYHLTTTLCHGVGDGGT